MICTLKFTYFDEKELVINIEEDKIEKFFECLNKHEIYHDEFHKTGFWTDVEKVRYIQSLIHEPKIEDKVEELKQPIEIFKPELEEEEPKV